MRDIKVRSAHASRITPPSDDETLELAPGRCLFAFCCDQLSLLRRHPRDIGNVTPEIASLALYPYERSRSTGCSRKHLQRDTLREAFTELKHTSGH